MQGAYNGATFVIAIDSVSVGTDVGVAFDIDNTGQVNYVADTVANTDSINIKFKATAITQTV